MDSLASILMWNFSEITRQENCALFSTFHVFRRLRNFGVSARLGRRGAAPSACRATTTFVFQSLQGFVEVMTFPHSPSSAQFLENVGVVSNTLRNAITIIKSPITTICIFISKVFKRYHHLPGSHQSSRLTSTDWLTDWVTDSHHFLSVLWR